MDTDNGGNVGDWPGSIACVFARFTERNGVAVGNSHIAPNKSNLILIEFDVMCIKSVTVTVFGF